MVQTTGESYATTVCGGQPLETVAQFRVRTAQEAQAQLYALRTTYATAQEAQAQLYALKITYEAAQPTDEALRALIATEAEVRTQAFAHKTTLRDLRRV